MEGSGRSDGRKLEQIGSIWSLIKNSLGFLMCMWCNNRVWNNSDILFVFVLGAGLDP